MSYWGRVVAAANIAFSLLIFHAFPLSAQASKQHGYVIGQARITMSEAWDDTTAAQSERAFCVVSDTVVMDQGQRVTVVKQVASAFTMRADPWSVSFRCPKGIPTAHTHTPNTCPTVETCKLGGVAAWDCGPSGADREMLVKYGLPYGIIQCDRSAFVFFFRDDDGKRWRLSDEHFIALLAAGVGANAIAGFDRDDGQYVDSWGTPDKLLHATMAFGMSLAAQTAGIEGWKAASLVCLAGAAYEASQGYVSTKDIGANCVGATAAWLWSAVWK